MQASLLLTIDRKSTRLNSSHAEIYALALHDALPIYAQEVDRLAVVVEGVGGLRAVGRRRAVDAGVIVIDDRSEEHTSELQSRRDLRSCPPRRSSDLRSGGGSSRRSRRRGWGAAGSRPPSGG